MSRIMVVNALSVQSFARKGKAQPVSWEANVHGGPDRALPLDHPTLFRPFHGPARSSNRSLAWESGAEDARTPDASRPPGVSEPRVASGVRPIYRRFSSGAGRPAVQGPNACEKSKGDCP